MKGENMKIKKIIIFFIIFLFLFSNFQASSILTDTTKPIFLNSSEIEDTYLDNIISSQSPSLLIGDEWIYNYNEFTGIFDYGSGMQSALIDVENLNLENFVISVSDIRYGCYYIDFFCTNVGDGNELVDVELPMSMGITNAHFLDGTEIWGQKIVDVNDFSLLSIELHLDGQLSNNQNTNNIRLNIYLSYNPSNLLLKFPLDVGMSWQNDAIELSGEAQLEWDGIESSFMQMSTTIPSSSFVCENIETVNCPAGSFDCYHVCSDIADTYSIFYSNEIVNFAELECEGLYDSEGILSISYYTAELQSYDLKNRAPYTPEKPIGPYYGNVGEDLTYNASTTDFEGDNIFYQWNFTDGYTTDWLGPFQPGEIVDCTHSFSQEGYYFVSVRAKDSHGDVSDYSDRHWVVIGENSAPDIPLVPDGPDTGEVDVTYSFSSSSEDPNNDSVYLWFDWGDGNNSDWIGPVPSGSMITSNHSWSTKGSFDIYVKAKDEYGLETEWSPSHTITIGNGSSPPYEPNNPSPVDGAVDVPVNSWISWDGGDPDSEDSVVYDIYFGIESSPPRVYDDWDLLDYDPGSLQYETTYYWQIIAEDNSGATSTGDIWSFTTQSDISYPPDKPTITGPGSGLEGYEYTFEICSSDPNNDLINYLVDWDDGAAPESIGPAESGQSIEASHSWENEGEYYITVKAFDEGNLESPISEPAYIQIEKDIPPIDEFGEGEIFIFGRTRSIEHSGNWWLFGIYKPILRRDFTIEFDGNREWAFYKVNAENGKKTLLIIGSCTITLENAKGFFYYGEKCKLRGCKDPAYVLIKADAKDIIIN